MDDYTAYATASLEAVLNDVAARNAAAAAKIIAARAAHGQGAVLALREATVARSDAALAAVRAHTAARSDAPSAAIHVHADGAALGALGWTPVGRPGAPPPAPVRHVPEVEDEASPFEWVPGEKERLSLRPIRHEDIWAFRKKIEGLRWTAEEVDLTLDKRDWDERLSPDERHFVKHQLALFSRFDVDVVANLNENFRREVDCLEAAAVLDAQSDQEWGHTEMYALQIEAVLSGAEREEVLNAVSTMPIIAKMRAWMLRWLDRGLPLGERLAAWAAVEGVLISSSFAALQWLRERNVLPGITEANTFIARDEGVHTLFTCLLVRKYLRRRPDPARVEAIYGSLVELLDEFVGEALPVRLIGMNDALMKQYVRFQADCVLIDMGYQPMFRVENPLKFMDKLTLNGVAKINFFEKTVSQYQTVTNSAWIRLALDATPVDEDEYD